MSQLLFNDDVTFHQRFLRACGLYTAKIDGDWGPKTDTAMQAFEALSSQVAAELGTFDSRTERCILTLVPKAQRAARTFLKAVRATGLDARILSGTRTYSEQNDLYRKGRFGNPGPVVTNARGGQSNHNFGIAWDIGIFDKGAYLGNSPLYAKAAQLGKTPGVEWGGDWKSFKDMPHYQLVTGLGVTALRQRFEAGQPFV